MSQDFEVFDLQRGVFTDEDSREIIKAYKEFDKAYQVYQAEKEIVKTILEQAIINREEELS